MNEILKRINVSGVVKNLCKCFFKCSISGTEYTAASKVARKQLEEAESKLQKFTQGLEPDRLLIYEI